MLNFFVDNTNNLDIIYKSFNGILFKNNGGILTLIQYPIGNTSTTYTVPSAISLISGDVPKAVGVIGIFAFLGASKLTSINISSSVTRIDGGAFQGMTSLVSAVIPQNVTTIGTHLFMSCHKLISVTISENITNIKTGMFQDTFNLKSIIIPRGVISIDDWAFLSAISLTDITFEAGSKLSTIGFHAFHNAQALAAITIPASVTSIGIGAFHKTLALKSITIPASVVSIGTVAFLFSGLTSVYIDQSSGLAPFNGLHKDFFGATDVNIQYSSFKLDLPTLAASVDSTITASFVENYTFAMGPYDAQLYTSITVADMQSVFKFSSDSVPNSDYLDNDDEAHVYACAKLFKAGSEYKLSTSIAPADANPSNSSNLLDHATATGKPHGVAVETFLQKVAARVIGSKLALDMLLNETAIAGGYIAAINKCITSVNNNFPSGAAASVATANASYAAERIYKAMTYAQSSRFGLKYKAIVPGTVPPSQGPHACTASPSTTAAAVSVEIAANGSVSNMTLTTPGTGFILGQSVAFRSGDVVVASIASINSVQVAMLNGTLTDQTPMPFEGGDMFTVMFTVSTDDGQLNVSGDPVSTSTKTKVNIKVV